MGLRIENCESTYAIDDFGWLIIWCDSVGGINVIIIIIIIITGVIEVDYE